MNMPPHRAAPTIMYREDEGEIDPFEAFEDPLRESDNGLVHEVDAAKPTNEYVLNVAFYSFLGFLLIEAVFALIARSQSMLADSEAMSVDALTYLFNLGAERYKHRPLNATELAMPLAQRQHQRELRRLYLELVPPTISVVTLILVTIATLREALTTLSNEQRDVDHVDDDVSVPIMLLFSAANLLLDVVNVTCFARAGSTFGLDVVRRESASIQEGIAMRVSSGSNNNNSVRADKCCSSSGSAGVVVVDETSRLIPATGGLELLTNQPHKANLPHGHTDLVNLNMCSAWTHVCADTMRSTAVLVAAGIATAAPAAVRPEQADSVAAVAVSIIIFGSLLPLLQGLVITAMQICRLHRREKNSRPCCVKEGSDVR